MVRAVQKLLGAATVTQTVELSLQEVLRGRRQDALRRRLGTFDLDLDVRELRQLRRHG